MPSGQLPSWCGDARFSPPSHNGFVTGIGTKRASEKRERRGPGGWGQRPIRSGGEGGRCLLFNSTGAWALRHSSANAKRFHAFSRVRLATEAMTHHIRPALPRAAGSIEGVSGGLRPRLAGDDKRRTDKGGTGAPGTAVITKTKPQTK